MILMMAFDVKWLWFNLGSMSRRISIFQGKTFFNFHQISTEISLFFRREENANRNVVFQGDDMTFQGSHNTNSALDVIIKFTQMGKLHLL